ncbi:MAG: hypothetical protein ABL893_18755 [Hyphomicrobium sp.]
MSNSQSSVAKFNWADGKKAVVIVSYDVPTATLPAFFLQLEKFAVSQKFEFSRSRVHPEKEQYSLDFTRPDIAISGDNMWAPNYFDMAFYVDLKMGGSKRVVEDILFRMNASIRDLSGVKLTRKK